LQGLEKYPEAIADFETALAVNPKSDDALEALISAKADSGQLPVALEMAMKKVELNPKMYRWHRLCMTMLLKSEKSAEAAKMLSETITLTDDPEEKANAIASRAWYYYENAKYDESIADYRTALQYSKENATSWMNLGVALLLSKGPVPEVFECLNRALQIIPKYDYALVNRGIAYQRSTKTDEAKADFEAVKANENSRPKPLESASNQLKELQEMSTESAELYKPVAQSPSRHTQALKKKRGTIKRKF